MRSDIQQVFVLKPLLVLILTISSMTSNAADGVNLHTFNDNHWYQQSYLWIVGGAILVLLLLAFLSNNHIDKAMED